MEDDPIFLNMEDDLIIVRPSLNLLEIVCWLEYVVISYLNSEDITAATYLPLFKCA